VGKGFVNRGAVAAGKNRGAAVQKKDFTSIKGKERNRWKRERKQKKGTRAFYGPKKWNVPFFTRNRERKGGGPLRGKLSVGKTQQQTARTKKEKMEIEGRRT